MKSMKPSHVRKFIINCMMMREIPYVAGPPAIGKSDIMASVAEEYNLKLIDVRLSRMAPEDLTGFPSLNENTGKATYSPFDTFPMEDDPIPEGYDGWMIFFDELSSANEDNLAAIYSVFLGHTLGGRKLHPKAVITSAGNLSSHSAIARELPDTIVTRILPVLMNVSSKDWIIWAQALKMPAAEPVISFIKKYPDTLNSVIDPSKREELEPYETPRSWGKVFKIMKLHDKACKALMEQNESKNTMGIPMDPADAFVGMPITPDIAALLHSAVGISSGQAFSEHFNDTMKLPFAWDVAQSPSSTPIPATTIGRAKLTNDLAEHFVETQEQSRDALLQFMNRMDKENAALFVQTLKENLGSTASDIKLLESVKKRLSVDDMNIPKSSEFEGGQDFDDE